MAPESRVLAVDLDLGSAGVLGLRVVGGSSAGRSAPSSICPCCCVADRI